MSPEQMIDTSSVDHRADIWSLGVVLFELLTGTRPFEGTSIPEICAGVLTVPAPALRERRPELDVMLEAIVKRCLAKNPDERHASVRALSADLEPFASSSDAAAETVQPDTEEAFFRRGREVDDRPTPISVAPLSSRSLRRVTLARALGVFGILSTVALAIWAFSGARGGPQELHGPLDQARAQGAARRGVDEGNTPSRVPSAEPVTVVPLPATQNESPKPGDPTNGSNEQHETSSTTAEAPHAAPRAAHSPGETRKPRAPAAPVLTPEEIRRRKEQYERWLREQGLQRVDEVVVPSPPSEASGNQSAE
jgi:serine/threonine protein kinase